MPKGGIRRIVQHKCKDGEIRRIEPVYFRDFNKFTGNRHFVRKAWFCGHCGFGDWQPLTKNGNATKE
jgi:hypothetical protein